ncbi:NAD(P)-dependent oxidoreductase [Lyngbya sp. CCY1209]|uniref:NAD-dependent epimerase/dehydratase family protein n=1 Tax=Lyngbya sp. CCY1209 TaxID=2886103 RepID=UPI002D20D760|nr:NAD(P)-dependent oxidoreductase [Lyngbya sp. CCY1209]MEB3883258.1 NAD(P)-dependent oxidoreductase [Lyngbya sp. CCY1209]
MRTVLVTGAAGRIGRSLRQILARHYHFRCLDLKPISEVEDAIAADVTDFDAVFRAMAGVDAVIHLAGNPDPKQPWEDVYGSSIAGTYTVFEAARRAGVGKIIYASSNHVSGWREVAGEERITPEMPVRPDSLYGVGKVFGEALGRFYADKYGMSVICLRIGSFLDRPEGKRTLKTWCSPRDLAQLVQKCLDRDRLGFQIFYGVSDNPGRIWAIENARTSVDYRPRDNAESERHHIN